MKIKILADSTCDLPQELVVENDITLVPLTVIKGDKDYKDGVTITPAEIFAHVAAGGELCSTSAVSVGEYLDYFGKYAEEYDALLHVNIGSGFSSSYQNACLAAEDFENVYVVDSQNLTTGQGMVVLKACELAKTAESMEEICKELEAYREKIETSFLVDKLDYLAKGGRCSSVAALGANLLNLKPCIEVKDGKMGVVKKYRGSYAKCLASYVKERLADREDVERDMVFLPGTVLPEGCFEAVMDGVKEFGGFRQVYKAEAGCTVSCHCGPGTQGIVFVKK